jgi:hypothetical protein
MITTSILTLLESSNTLLSKAKMMMKRIPMFILRFDFLNNLYSKVRVERCIKRKGNLMEKMVAGKNFSQRICQN